MSALLFSTSMIIFLIGLVSEQITSLIYNHQQNNSVIHPNLASHGKSDNVHSVTEQPVI